jgi:hypothetical protein
MTAKEAVRAAVEYVKEIFAGETFSNLGLEEIEYLPERKEWHVTVGFSRPWDYPKKEQDLGSLFPSSSEYSRPPARDYKVVHIDDRNGEILAVKQRLVPELAEA